MKSAGALRPAPSAGWTALVERDGERQVIDAALDGAEFGGGRVVLVYGEAGVGRTSLLRAAALEAESRGLTVLEADGSELERGYGFGIVRQLLEARVAGLTASQRRALLGEAGAAAESALGIGPPESRVPGGGFDQIEGVYHLVARLAAIAPLLVVVDDLQWCDRPSLDFVCFLGHRATQLPVTIVAAWRRGEPGVRAGRLQALAGKADTFFLRPAALSPAGVRTVLRRKTGREPEDDAVAAVHEQTGGRPFLVTELVAGMRLRDLRATATSRNAIETLTPESVRRTVVARLRRHPEAVQRFAQAVAVLGRAPLAEAATLAGVDQDRACAVAAALVRAGILRDDATVTYAQPLLSRAVYGTLSSIERADMHRRAAELLCTRDVERTAHHLMLSEPAGDARFGDVLRQAALQALDEDEPTRARRLLERALGESEGAARGATLVQLAELELGAGDLEAALAHASEAQPLVAGAAERVAVALVSAEAMSATSGWEPALRLLVDAEAAGLAEDDSELVLRLQAAAATLCACAHAPLPPGIPGVDGLAGETPTERALLGAWASHATLTGSACAERVAEVCGQALSHGIDYLTCQAALLAGATEAVERMFEHEPDAPLVELAIRSQVALARGDLAAAEADGRVALAQLEGPALTVLRRRVRSDLLAGLAVVALERARFDDAEQLLEELEAGPVATCLRLALALARAEPAADLAMALEQAPVGVLAPGICWRPLAALAHHAANDGVRALALASEHLEFAKAWGCATQLGRALLVRGIVGPGAERLGFVQQAVAVLEDSSAALDLAHGAVEAGSALRRARRRREAREQLMRGADLAHRCGADALAARAMEELVAVGARPRRTAFSGIAALTASELRVARLAATGMTNREIARELIVSVKTVSGQLMSVYRKLDVHDRGALASAMREEPEAAA